MNLITFIENRYQELTLECQQNKDKFEVFKDAEIKASHYILSGYRKVLSYALIPKVIYNFIEVNLKWREEPIPVLVNKMKDDLAGKETAKAMLANVSSIEAHVIETKNTSD